MAFWMIDIYNGPSDYAYVFPNGDKFWMLCATGPPERGGCSHLFLKIRICGNVTDSSDHVLFTYL